jgi:TRAP-type C4-dicarboxylate transport system substrate-binding protein
MKHTFGKLAATGIAAATALAIAMPAQAAEELKLSTALGQKHDQSTALFKTFSAMMKKDESTVKINYIGGPEVTPNRKQGSAMKRGLIDIIMSPTTYYSNLVTAARLTGISNVTPEEWRANGGYKIYSDIWAKKMNAVILAWPNWYNRSIFFLWMKDKPKLSKVTGIDLKGLKFRTTALYTPFLKAMGATTKNISPAEVYTALERGVVDGLAWPEGGVAFRGWHRFIKYKVGPAFFRSTTFLTMNKNRFDKLSKKGQDQLMAAGSHYEKASGALLEKLAAADDAKIFKDGVSAYNVPGEYGKAFTATILKANWADASKRKYSVDFELLKSKMLKSGS